jgi:uncharacterized protein YdcH (DUF465 family)
MMLVFKITHRAKNLNNPLTDSAWRPSTKEDPLMEKITSEEELKAHLATNDDQFRELSRKHGEYDRRLVELESKHSLTQDEQIEEVRLKKLKLNTKDQMREIMSRFKTGRVN